MLRTLLAMITSRLLWGFVGITAICVMVWTIGPLVSIGDYRPLESEFNRFATVLVLYLLWLCFRLVPRVWRSWQNRRLVRKLEADNRPQEEAAPVEDNPEQRLLTERFNEATQLLKKARFVNPKSRKWPAWMQYFSRQYLYQLPWYIIIGAPGAGKTTALVNSGLHFPLAEKFGKAALRGVGGTRNCDWWFTDEAILIDTAGRYTTQESQHEQDAGEWRSFMSLLKKYRARQPINGVMVTISVADLLSESEQVLHAQATALRQRLMELHDRLGIQFPVYVMVTKSDLMKGFTAYFSEFNKQQRDQIWGFTWPWRESELNLPQEFDYQFSRLHQRLNDGLPDIMIVEHDSQKRAESYLFPQEFLSLQPVLKQYLGVLFAASGFERPLRPRGVYFTSGTQEGLPFDRVMGQLNRALNLPPLASDTRGNDWQSLDAANPIPAARGQSFFLQGLLQKVIFQESGLAGSNPWWEVRNRLFNWIGYGVMTFLLLIGMAWWLISYSHNKQYLADVQAKVPTLEKQSAALPPLSQSDIYTLQPLLGNLEQLPQTPKIDVNSPPFSWQAGLYRGDQVIDASQSLYEKALKQLLLPIVAQQVTSWLRSDDGSDVDYSYEALKAYQMLYMPKQYDGKLLRTWIMLNLQRQLPAGVTQSQLKQIDDHLGNLLDDQINTSPYERDDALIAREQAVINRAPVAQRVYGRLKRLLVATVPGTVTLVDLGGPQTELAFSRKSGQPITNGIPGLFTPKGYWDFFNKNIDSVTASIRTDDVWVLNRQGDSVPQKDMENTVRQMYMEDFIAHWDALLNDVQLNHIGDLGQRINTARMLSGRTSPMRNLMINVSRYVTLERAEKKSTQGMIEKGSAMFTNTATQTLQALFRARKAAQDGNLEDPEQQVMAHFAPIIEQAQFTDAKNKTIPFDEQLKDIDDLYSYLTAVQDASNTGIQAPSGDVISRMQADAGREPEPFRSMLLSLAVGASSDTQRRDMANVQKRSSVEVGSFCRQAIAGRYPLVHSSSVDITPDDLARMFAPGTGLMDTFFRENLANKVDTTRANWRFAPGVDGKSLPGSESMLRPFQQAQTIRDAFFAAGSTTPSYRITITPVSMDNNILNLTLDVDGQLLRYSHGPQTPQVVSWPGPGQTGQVRMQLGLTDGTTDTLSTSGPWALNRLFDKARLSPGSTSLSHIARFSISGHQVELQYTANSIRNPLQLPGFSCP
ncbi:type VI secretion system membrane subunit TssM [Rouxiella sp. WC2420]|uniref:Type VI secretion system membrane subunit TssM n=1 Tax=Rouxiella sp. WC2420 TaxID=3234145 RepID=A0AB39VTV9_9GAMM